MMSFLSWQEAYAAGRDRRITYAMGPEARLRDLVINTMKKDTTDKVTFWADGNDDELWSELFTHPLRQSQVKLVTVRNAHKVKNWQPLDRWLREMRTVKTIMEADKPLFSVPMYPNQFTCVRGHKANINIKNYRNGRQKRTCSECDEAEAILSKRGRLILCAPPTTDATKRDAISMICNLSTASRSQAENLLEKTNWRIDAAIEVVEKLNLIDAPIASNIITALGTSSDDTTFERALREGNRAIAATAAKSINPHDVPRILNRLEDWLTNIARVARMLHTGATTAEIAKATNVSWGYAVKLAEWASRFDIASVNKATIALANAEREWYKNNHIGVLEVLSLQW